MSDSKKTRSPETILTHAGRDPAGHHGAVNIPPYRTSTVLFETLEQVKSINNPDYTGYRYGRMGNPSSRAFEDAVAELEGADGAVSHCSGMAAIAMALDACTKQGDHILICDSTYSPTRKYCDNVLARYGVDVEYYDPMIGAGIDKLLRDNTSLVYLEAPGSLTFEVQDVPAIAAAAKKRDIAVLMDNTWATPLFFRPFDHGVDISIHAATKYMVGHADAMLGVCTARGNYVEKLRKTAWLSGHAAGPDALYLGLRGLRSMAVRLKQHEAQAMELAEWLKDRPEVVKVLHPAFEDCPGHEYFKRDFKGASGLFSITLKPGYDEAALARMLDGMNLFGMGFSWGGFESLIMPDRPDQTRSATIWNDEGMLLRIHAGLENISDLKEDLDQGFQRLSGT